MTQSSHLTGVFAKCLIFSSSSYDRDRMLEYFDPQSPAPSCVADNFSQSSSCSNIQQYYYCLDYYNILLKQKPQILQKLYCENFIIVLTYWLNVRIVLTGRQQQYIKHHCHLDPVTGHRPGPRGCLLKLVVGSSQQSQQTVQLHCDSTTLQHTL